MGRNYEFILIYTNDEKVTDRLKQSWEDKKKKKKLAVYLFPSHQAWKEENLAKSKCIFSYDLF